MKIENLKSEALFELKQWDSVLIAININLS